MTTPAQPAGAPLFAEAIRVCALNPDGSPKTGANVCVQTKNVVVVTPEYETQAGVDVTKVDGRGDVCLSWKGNDTKKRVNLTVGICDEDLFLEQLMVGGVLFTGNNTRTQSVTTSTGSANLTAGSFTSADVGATITGTGIPAATTILSQNGSTAVMSKTATAAGTVTATIATATQVEGYQSPKVGEVGQPNGVSVELWCRHIVGSAHVGYRHYVFPRVYFSLPPSGAIGAEFADMNFLGFATENPAWNDGPMHDFDHDSTGTDQYIYADSLPSPLADGYTTVTP